MTSEEYITFLSLVLCIFFFYFWTFLCFWFLFFLIVLHFFVQIRKYRDPMKQQQMIGVPEEYLGSHAFHFYCLTSPDDSYISLSLSLSLAPIHWSLYLVHSSSAIKLYTVEPLHLSICIPILEKLSKWWFLWVPVDMLCTILCKPFITADLCNHEIVSN